MKSAYELAMERLAKDGPIAHLTDAQREEIAAIDARFRSRIAEREVFLGDLLTKARATGNHLEAAQIEEQMRREIAALREQSESEKDKVRHQKG